jgi:pyruvate/2-oxoglutarate dehydrogenase complex dihydrolipoamide dehydrogenase (E3) component
MPPQTPPIVVEPMDQYNQITVSNLHPLDWVNPAPARRYNLVVIGGGTAGLVTAAGAALLGGKVALVEKHLLGGDCTNVGCVPSKAMIRSARVLGDIYDAAEFGVHLPAAAEIDFTTVMQRLRRVRSVISPHDSARRFQQEFGIDVFFGAAKFIDSGTIAVGETRLRFAKAVIATGSSPMKLRIPGLHEAGYLTNKTVFSLTDRPQRLAVIGGGYIGCELAQTFQRLGCQVILFNRSDRLLSREDADAANLIQQVFEREGVQLILNSNLHQVERTETAKVLHYSINDIAGSIEVDQILVATGRSVDVSELNLEAVGVKSDPKRGVVVNDYMQTTNPRIYAAGDVCMDWKFTHAANAAARIVIQNALFSVFGLGRAKLSNLTMPWCTFTDPEIAHVGLYPKEAEQRGISVETIHVPFKKVDRAVVDGETEGFAKLYLKQGTDKILGATIVARHAGEMISEVSLAITNKLGLGAIGKTIHPYPTQAEAIRAAADEYSLRQLDKFKKLAAAWLSLRR